MENLWCVEKLTKLQLDNNIIEKIEGLESLVNLVWLGEFVIRVTVKYEFTDV